MPEPIRLEGVDLPIDQLFLDPNNPRYADKDLLRKIPEEKVHQDTVQERAMTRMLDGFEVEQLKESIQNLGFLHVDRLVVTELPDDVGFKVIEGNRRLAALKSLLQDEAAGEIELTAEVKATMDPTPTIVIRGGDAKSRDHHARTLQGVRHVAGVRPWGPYQQAQLIGQMLEDGRQLTDIKEVLGLQTRRINELRRVFYALDQMANDADFGDHAKPHLFSHFLEALNTPPVRAWLGWDDASNTITNDDRRPLFYSWLVDSEEDGERIPRKVTDAKDFRRLPAVLEDAGQARRFHEDPRLTLREAYEGIDNPGPELDWRSILRGNLNTLKQVPAVDIAAATSDDLSLIEEIQTTCQTLLAQIHGSEGATGDV